jgi:asparagine synthase (glutamine-hydrolysing)
MGAFAACLFFGAGPEARRELETAAPFLRPTLDGHEFWRAPGIQAVRSRFIVCPEDRLSELPPVETLPRFVCFADARLDNRAELVVGLASEGVSADASDTELILAAWRRWDADCARHLLGDFAFFIWDRLERRGFGATDPLGIRSLRYAVDRDVVIVGSRARAVAQLTRKGPRTNEELLSEYVCGRDGLWVSQTPFSGVSRLPAGCSLVVDSAALRVSTYDALDEDRTPAVASIDEALEYFRTTFADSVRVRMRQRAGGVGISLSGGLDSSSIAGAAQALVASGAAVGPVFACSSVFEHSAAADERPFIRDVLRASPALKPIWIQADDCWTFGDIGVDPSFQLDEVEGDADRRRLVRRALAVADAGARVLLSGHWADQLLGGYGRSEFLFALPMREWRREARQFLDAAGGPRPMAWRMARLLRDRWRAPLRHRGAWARERRRRELLGGRSQLFMRTFEQWHDHSGVEWRVPYLDRRIVTFLLGVPIEWLIQDGRAKWIQRTGLADFLPEQIRNRRGGAHFSELTQRGFVNERVQLRSWLRDSEVVARGWINADLIAGAMSRYSATGARADRQVVVRWFGVEAWLRGERG